ncbi:hypothetical protein DVA86_16635 [Streptomyces armeniacus]|uniref:DUF4034 domain-containing protein n=1 Tax=Streptomyces armeniacus TaxID=83291 RepID=A0A345XQX8_9ACTN|nr:hypothetical protein [Streptomyces armeniacus]AXK34044.1 hypothetical protein DVA86_16635 [Streptomyces armeniacus]
MTPPSPPPVFSWRSAGTAPDPALGDGELAAARDALAQGRWSAARELLTATGDDWDRRGHRLTVLAEGRSTGAWAREWLLAEPDSKDAAVLLACATAYSAACGRQRTETAHEAVEAAARAAPADPSPWLAALVLARHTGTAGDCRHAFEQVRERHPGHHHAHHLMAAALAEHPRAGGPDVYDFADQAVRQAPGDSPLALLPVVAHAESFRVLATGGLRADPYAAPEPPAPAAASAAEHWSGRHAQHLVRAAFDWWLEWGNTAGGHPRHLVDLNFLTYAKFHEGRMAEAAALFQRVGTRLTPAPWSYAGRDPRKAFRTARKAAVGAA